MIQHGVPQEMARKMGKTALSCSRLFERCPDELATIAAFVETEMKGQDLPNAGQGRDAFIGATFERIFPLVLHSAECRRSVENMMQQHPEFSGSDLFAHHDENPNYTIGPDMAEVLYLAGSAVFGSIVMVTSGETERPLVTDEGVQYKPTP
ncbi:hypothetical protein [Salinithrix halophila]|uniref:Uncharacterized protein n=1 Tax=Salinithrix halophila TaxID=1485204 RepID=A0ABV8JDC3_9BACL